MFRYIKFALLISILISAAVSGAQPSTPCLSSVGINTIRHIPNLVETNCLLKQIDSTVFEMLCPGGQTLQKFAVYTHYQNLILNMGPEATRKAKISMYEEWRKIGFYDDNEINSALNKIPMDAYNCGIGS